MHLSYCHNMLHIFNDLYCFPLLLSSEKHTNLLRVLVPNEYACMHLNKAAVPSKFTEIRCCALSHVYSLFPGVTLPTITTASHWHL